MLWILDHADIAGGGQRFALRLARYTAERRGLEVRTVCPAESALAGWLGEAELEVTDAEFPPFRPGSMPRAARAVLRTRRLLDRVGVDDLVVANSARVQAYLFAASRLRRPTARVVNLMHEQDSARRASARFAYRRFGSLLVIGEAAARTYREHLPGVVVHEASNFLLEEELAPLEALRSGRRAPDGPAVLGALARMIPEKGLVDLVDELAAVRPLWRRVIVAAFPQDEAYERRLRARVEQLGLTEVVDLVGPRPAAEVLAELDALVVPSTGYEAQPTVIIEALAAGVPVIVRSPLWAAAYEDLPILAYDSSDDLATALGRIPLAPAERDAVIDRFAPERFLNELYRAGS